MAGKNALEIVKRISKSLATSTGFETNLKHIVITGGGNGRCTAEFVVRPENLNGAGGLHGGFTATVIDNFTTYAMLTGHDCHPGVTVDLHVSYLNRATEGETIIIDAKTVKAGKTMAYLDCELRKKDSDVVIARGTQTKFIGF